MPQVFSAIIETKNGRSINETTLLNPNRILSANSHDSGNKSYIIYDNGKSKDQLIISIAFGVLNNSIKDYESGRYFNQNIVLKNDSVLNESLELSVDSIVYAFNDLSDPTRSIFMDSNGDRYTSDITLSSLQLKIDNTSNTIGDIGNTVNVFDLSDLPAPSGGVITLEDSKIYQINGSIDLGSNRLVMGVDTTIRGNSPKLDFLFSTTTSALITSTSSFRMIEVGFQANSGSIFDLNGTGSEICLCVGVRFFGTGALGDVADFDLFETNIALFVGFSSGITFSGSNGSFISVDTEYFQTSAATSIDLQTATFNLVRILGCSFNVESGGTGINIALNNANINVGGIGLINSSSFTGLGSPTNGYSALNQRWNVSATNSGVVYSDRLSPTGFGYYQDGQTSPATLSLTTAFQKLQIDGGGSNTETSFLPNYLISVSGGLWDTTNDEITPVSVGDSYTLRIDLEVTAKGGGVSAIYLQLDIGGGGTPTIVIVDRVISIPKTAPFTMSVGFPIFTGSTFLANRGQIFVATDAGTATISGRAITISRISSGAI